MPESNKVKFSEEDLTKIKEFQKKYLDIQMGYGQVQISRGRLEQQLISLDEANNKFHEELASTQSDEQTFISKIGIYDEERNLIAVANLATPVKKTEDRALTFKLKLDI